MRFYHSVLEFDVNAHSARARSVAGVKACDRSVVFKLVVLGAGAWGQSGRVSLTKAETGGEREESIDSWPCPYVQQVPIDSYQLHLVEETSA